MENLIGRKCKGFKFNDNQNRISYNNLVASKVGETGTITYVDADSFDIKFKCGKSYCYPVSEVHKHLIPLEDEIPTLGEGKLMFVSDDGINWIDRIVHFKHRKKYFAQYNTLTHSYSWWNFAKEIETKEIVELTLKDISEGKGVGVKPSLIRIKE